MRTLIVSDLHLGNDGPFDIFAGAQALPAMIDHHAARGPVRVFVNGDGVDFLMNEDPLELDVDRAVQQARAIVEASSSAPTFQALGRVLSGGGEVIIRLGNHDVELALPEVQAVFREAMGHPGAEFQLGDEPAILQIGGAKLLLTHGENSDDWNRYDHDQLVRDPAKFDYPPGSELVRQVLNPMKAGGMRFVDLLIPDVEGAVLAAMAIDLRMVLRLAKAEALPILKSLFKNKRTDDPFAESAGGADPLASGRLDDAGLTDTDRLKLQALLDAAERDDLPPEDPAALVHEGLFSDEPSALEMRLAKAGLGLFARAQKRIVGDAGVEAFSFSPDDAEWEEAQRMARKYGADAVTIGHTHSARWRQEADLTYVNTGCWISLMRLPDPDASDAEWAAYIRELKSNPGLDPDRMDEVTIEQRFTYLQADPAPGGGVALSLVHWRPSAEGGWEAEVIDRGVAGRRTVRFEESMAAPSSAAPPESPGLFGGLMPVLERRAATAAKVELEERTGADGSRVRILKLEG